MAETPEELTKKLAELLEKGLFPKFKSLEDNVADLNEAVKTGVTLDKLSLSTKKRASEEEKIVANKTAAVQKSYAKKLDEVYQSARQGDITRAEAQQKIIQLRDATAQALANPELQMAFEKQAVSIERNAKINDAVTSEFAQSVKKNWVDGTKALTSSFGSIMSSYQSSSSQIGMGANILQQSASLAGGAISGAGAAAGAAGGALSMFRSGPLRTVGLGLTVLGSAAGLVGAGLTKTASAVLPFLQAELEKNIGAFQGLSSSGALFAGGLGEMIRVAGQGGLTLAQMSSVVKNNTESLALMGGGVATGTKRLSAALEAGGGDFRKKLLNLGYTVEEQAGLIAETAGDMRRAGRDMRNVTPKELVEQSEKYATNLRVLADISGEDAKKLKDKARAELAQIGVQAEITKRTRAGDTGAVARFQSVQELAASSGKLVNDAARQLLGQGQLLGETATQFSLFGPAGDEFQKTVLDIKNDTTLAPAEATAKMNDALAKLNESAKNNDSLNAILGAGIEAGVANIAAFGQALGEMVEKTNKFTEGGAEAARIAAENQKSTLDKQTQAATDVILKTQEAMMKTQQAIMDTGIMTGYATAVSTATDALIKMVDAFRKEFGGATVADTTKAKDESAKTGEAIGQTVGTVAGGAIGGIIGSLGGPVGTAVGVAAGGYLGEVLGGIAGKFIGSTLGGTVKESIAAPPPMPKTDATLPENSRRRQTLERLGEGLDSNAPNLPPPTPPTPTTTPTQPQVDNRSFLQKTFGLSALGRNAPVDSTVTATPKPPSGPATGTPAMLNGKNMTVPLPDNFDISKLSNDELRNLTTAAEASGLGSELSAKIDAIATAMQAPNTESKATQQKTLETDQQIAALMQAMNGKFDDMIDHMREVVSNTDRTARGVA